MNLSEARIRGEHNEATLCRGRLDAANAAVSRQYQHGLKLRCYQIEREIQKAERIPVVFRLPEDCVREIIQNSPPWASGGPFPDFKLA